jgi:hypothetical protein
MEKAEVADFLKAIGQDMLKESAEKLHDIEVGGAEACTPHFPVGEGDRTVRERDNAAVGESHLEDRGSEIGKGRGAVVIGLTVDVPRDGPDLGIDGRQQAGLSHRFLEESAGDGGKRFDRDKEIGAGG